MFRTILLGGHSLFYRGLLRPLLFRHTAQDAHRYILQWLKWADRRWSSGLLRTVCRFSFKSSPVEVGGVLLPNPLMLAAGLVKGRGFASEAEALEAVEAGENIIPGWRSLPAMVGVVEFGSYTRWPRLGNPGTVMWRDRANRSTQNRVGLKNPGVLAAARFLHANELPPVFGINLAVSPGVSDAEQELQEILEGVDAFIKLDVRPSWFTLNLSCPNTEDDPGANQTAEKAERLCGTLVEYLDAMPLWVKISPDLATEQYRVLMKVFETVGVQATVATNTLSAPVPDNVDLVAGIGGVRLHQSALSVVKLLMEEKSRQGYRIDIIACGGIESGATFNDFARLGVKAAQYWSSLVYRGPLVAVHILQER